MLWPQKYLHVLDALEIQEEMEDTSPLCPVQELPEEREASVPTQGCVHGWSEGNTGADSHLWDRERWTLRHMWWLFWTSQPLLLGCCSRAVIFQQLPIAFEDIPRTDRLGYFPQHNYFSIYIYIFNSLKSELSWKSNDLQGDNNDFKGRFSSCYNVADIQTSPNLGLLIAGSGKAWSWRNGPTSALYSSGGCHCLINSKIKSLWTLYKHIWAKSVVFV